MANRSLGWVVLGLSGVFSAGCVAEPGCEVTATCSEQPDAGEGLGDAGAVGPSAQGGAGAAGAGPGEQTVQPENVAGGGAAQSAGAGGGGGTELGASTGAGGAGAPVINDRVDGGTMEPSVPGESSVDAGPTGPELTTIIVRNEASPETPLEHILVLVSAPDGTRIDAARTDAEGKVELEVPAGSTVSTMAVSNYTDEGVPETFTSVASWFEVPAVDPLYVSVEYYSGEINPPPPPSGGVDVSVNLLSSRAGTPEDYGELWVGCNGMRYVENTAPTGFDATYTFTEVTPCAGANEIGVWGFARGGWAYGTVSMAAEVKTIELAADDADWDTSTLFFEGVPEGAQALSYDVDATMTGVGGMLYFNADSKAPLDPQGTSSVQLPHAPLQHVSKQGFIEIQTQPTIGAYVVRSGAAVADIHWNVSQDLALFELLSSVDRQIPNRPAITWHIADTGNLGDYIRMRFEWQDTEWAAYLPPARQGTVQMPELPAGPVPFDPGPEDVIEVDARMIDDLFLDDYAGLVSQPYDYWSDENVNGTYIYPY